MHGMEAHSKHPGLRTPSSARLRPALVVTSSFREHRRTEHPFLVYLLSPILEFSDVQNSTICRTISFCAPAGAAYCSAAAPGQAPSPVPMSVGRLPSSTALVVAAIVSSCLRNFLASSISRFLSLWEVLCQTSGHTPSGLLVFLYLLITLSPILSQLGSPGRISSGFGVSLGLLFRPSPILLSITSTRAYCRRRFF